MNSLTQRLAIVVSLILSWLTTATPAAQAQERIRHEEKIHFTSGGKKIGLERFRPAHTKKLPAIVLVPESKPLKDVGPVYRAIASRIAQEGYEVVLVQFFDRTGHKNGVKPEDFKDPKRAAEMKKHFEAWMDTVADCVQHVRTSDGVQNDRVGLIGFSLGGFLATSVASRKELDVQAVASYFGGIPDELCPKVEHLPPTLIVNGLQDEVVPFRNALTVIGITTLLKTPCEPVICKDGHLFEKTLTAHILAIQFDRWVKGEKFEMEAAMTEVLRDNAMVKDAVQKTMRFFNTHIANVKKAK